MGTKSNNMKLIITLSFILLFTNILFSQSPGNVSANFEFWLKANAGITGSTPITAWADQSGKAVTNTITGTPDLNANSVNYNNSVTLDGTNDYFTNGLTINPDVTDISICVVYYNPTDLNRNQVIVSQLSGTGTGRNILSISDSHGDKMRNTFQGSANMSNVPVTYGEWDLFSFTLDANGASSVLNFYQKGAPDGSYSTDPEFADGNWRMGTSKTTAGLWNGDFAELIIYSQTLSATDRNKIESYLALKYAITLDNTLGGTAGDYNSSAGTTIWDESVSSDYHNDVIGIGRDDASALLQKQSHQIDDTTRLYIGTLTASNSSNSGSFYSDRSFVMSGHNNGKMCDTRAVWAEKPTGIHSRLEREWKVTKTNFFQFFNMDFTIASSTAPSYVDITDLRLLVDSDGDFSDASVYNEGGGLSFSYSAGVISVTGISKAQIPNNSTRYITIASVNSATPLPIELISFEATAKKNRTVQLTWQTASEKNNDYFTIERSVNGIDWKEIDRIDGAGNSNKLLSYSAIDYNPFNGISYYRLKQTDFDGQFDFSQVRSINTDLLEVSQVNIYPNPTNNQITIEALKEEPEQTKIYNALGQDVTSLTKVIENTETKVVIDLSNLSGGLYYVKNKTTANMVYKK